MMQSAIDGDVQPKYYIAKGLHQKRNYFCDENYIFDLEFNVPIS